MCVSNEHCQSRIYRSDMFAWWGLYISRVIGRMPDSQENLWFFWRALRTEVHILNQIKKQENIYVGGRHNGYKYSFRVRYKWIRSSGIYVRWQLLWNQRGKDQRDPYLSAIFGGADALFEQCTLRTVDNHIPHSYVTAPSGKAVRYWIFFRRLFSAGR